jgi:RNA recognition motif-containing protein
MNIYVGNLPLEVTEDELRREFMAYGEVISAIIMNDKYIGSGQPRGYGFVEMPSQSEGKAAITALNDKTLGHKTISVVEALPLSDKKGKGSSVGKRGSWSRNRVRQRSFNEFRNLQFSSEHHGRCPGARLYQTNTNTTTGNPTNYAGP